MSLRLRQPTRWVACGSILAYLLPAVWVAMVHGQAGDPQAGIYTAAQAARGGATYKAECAVCHGEALQGKLAPPLTGLEFMQVWASQSLLDLVSKIQNTMPANAPGKLSREQTVDVVAYVIEAGKLPAGKADLPADDGALKQAKLPATAAPAQPRNAATMAGAPTFTPGGNLAQVMRGILFPSSNVIFNVQNQDPGIQKVGWKPGDTAFSWVDWGAGIYSGWELVDYAAVALTESAPMMLMPGRRCENGRPVPVGRADWIKYTVELADAGRLAYKASQSRDRDAVIEATSAVADACLNCHEVYRDKPGGTDVDPSNKAARCVP
jgi:mono/diheme cytochrome c family protein